MKRKGCVRFLVIALAGLFGLCVLLALVSVLINSTLPERSSVVDRLSAEEKIRLAEVVHLRQALGDSVLPGWSGADIPLIVYNEENIFLTGLAEPGAGWRTVPRGDLRGVEWRQMPDDDFLGQPYFWQPIPASGHTTQAFTVRVGDAWAASLGTYDWMKISLVAPMREDLPAFLRPIAPYGLLSGMLMPGSDAYTTIILHEAAHAYQGIRAPERLAAAESSPGQNEDRYPWGDETHIEAWQAELDTLHAAMLAGSDAEAGELARRFLDLRAARRAAARLTPGLVDYERQREWAEGIAKYAERKIYVLAADPGVYTPLPEIQQDPEFKDYKSAQRKWDQEVDQLRRTAEARGDGRFYYTGFAQAVLLDRLAPGWKERLFDDGVFLEDLLLEAVQ